MLSNIDVVPNTISFLVYRYRIELDSDIDIRYPTPELMVSTVTPTGTQLQFDASRQRKKGKSLLAIKMQGKNLRNGEEGEEPILRPRIYCELRLLLIPLEPLSRFGDEPVKL